ncbi:MAG: hypothetical protein KBA26_08160 [Candidatus Delongbacteria bacterium]|nr:hypothetical protein [Candidatus Delongbacteria bacterium]
MNHQDTLTLEMVESFARNIFPEHIPLHLTRLHSENNQVYRVEGRDLDVVLKIEGRGNYRHGGILREINTIKLLRGRINVPNILTHGDYPRPYLVLPFYHRESTDRILLDCAIADHLNKLAAIRPLSSRVKSKKKWSWKRWLQIVLDRAATDKRFSTCQSSIEALGDELSELLSVDSVIYGQPQPGEIIPIKGDYVVIDWSEGLAPCLVGWQIADLTFYNAISNFEAAVKRVSFFQKAIHSFPIHMDIVYSYWLIYCIHVGWWLADQKKDDKIVTKYMEYLQKLTTSNKTLNFSSHRPTYTFYP